MAREMLKDMTRKVPFDQGWDLGQTIIFQAGAAATAGAAGAGAAGVGGAGFMTSGAVTAGKKKII